MRDDVVSGSDGERPEQRRILRVLVLAQLFSGAGLAAGLTVGALLAQDMLGTTGLAGLPAALYTIGSASGAVMIGRVSHRLGRRPGLALGYAAGAAGAVGVVAAAVLDNVPLLFVSLLVYGSGSAANLQARYAGADLATPARRGRAVSTVLVATTVGGVIGPNLVSVMADVAGAWGIPALAGPFLLAGAAYATAAAVLALLLHPDPLHAAREWAAVAPAPVPAGRAAAGDRVLNTGVLLGAMTMVLTQLVMIGVMTMTPVHMTAHGHGVGAAGLVIAVHIAAMYLPSPLTGWLVDRIGRRPVAAGAGFTLLLAGLVAGLGPEDSVPLLVVAMGLLGLGWNLGLVSGTAMITDSVPLENRARVQGTVDVCIAVSGAGGGLASGLVVAAAGYPTLAIAGGLVALVIVPVVALGVRTPQPALTR